MKRNQVDEILVDFAKRRKFIIKRIVFIAFFLIVSLALIYTFISKNKSYYVTYTETNDIDYTVKLKDNNFFKDGYLGSDNTPIASIIDYINATFNYRLSMAEKNINYNYSYRVEALVDVKEEKGSKPLYNYKEDIVKETVDESDSDKELIIKEDVVIDYNHYNELIKSFVNIYGLEDISSTLTINMYINVTGSCEEFTTDTKNETVLSLVIPLTTKTVEIDIKNNIPEQKDKVIACREVSKLIYVYLISGLLSMIASSLLIATLVKYIMVTRTAETMYDLELKKILNFYHSYIQKIDNKIDVKTGEGLSFSDKDIYKDCIFYKLESFTDMLEIRDSINSPILMTSNDKNTATYFLILDVKNRAVYLYGLRVTDIKKKIKTQNKKAK